MDILQIVCKDLVAINEQDREYDFYTLIKLERVLQDDHKIICLNVPTKTGKQCAYLQHKIRSCSDPYRLRQLENKLKEEEWKRVFPNDLFVQFGRTSKTNQHDIEHPPTSKDDPND